MFEISEGMRVILITRLGVNSFNDALAEADIPYRLFRVPDGYSPASSDDVHMVSAEQVRLPASCEPHGVVDLTVESAEEREIIDRLVHQINDGDSVSGYDPVTGNYVRDLSIVKE